MTTAITAEDLKPIQHIAVARLYFNKDLPQYEDALRRTMGMAMENGLVEHISLPTANGLAVDIARNRIVLQCLQDEVDAIVWIDTDMIVPDDALVRLVMMANAGHLIAGGVYRRGRPPFGLLAELEYGEEATLEDLEALADENGGVVPVAVCAGGFTIVRMEVYRVLSPPWYCNWDFVSGKGAVGEDRFFLLRCAEQGIKPVVDPYLGAVHWALHGPVPTRPGQPEVRYTL